LNEGATLGEMVEKRSALILWACGFAVNTAKALTAKDAEENREIAEKCPLADGATGVPARPARALIFSI
jgi:hypothetical protein